MDTLETTDTAAPTLTAVQALAAVMAEVQPVGKDGYNREQNFKFRGIDAVVNAAGPAFRKHGVIPIPRVQSVTYRDVTTSKGKPMRECTLRVTYRFYGPRGDYIEAEEIPGESMDVGDKGTAKAMSVAYRIALLQVLSIPTDDPDPDEFSPERGNGGESYKTSRPSTPSAPPVQPSEEALELMASVNAAKHQGALKRVWDRITEANTRGILSVPEMERLTARVTELVPELPPDPDAAEATPEPASAAIEGELIETGATE